MKRSPLRRKRPAPRPSLEAEVPYGFCQCGCGERTTLAPQTSKARGWVKGEPIRFRPLHHVRMPEVWAAVALKRRERAGVPPDAPTNAAGDSCVQKACAHCGREFLVKWSERDTLRCCSMKCSAVVRRQHKGMKARTGKANPNFKGGGRVGVRDREGERRWYEAMARTCQHPACPKTELAMALHHVVYVQHVVKAGGDKWDRDNSLTLCFACHSSHHRKGRYTVPLAALRDENYAFAFALMGPAAYDYLRRYYAGTDPRLEALLEAAA